MTVIVTDAGFGPDDWTGGFTGPADIAVGGAGLDLPPDTDPATLARWADGPAMIRIAFPSFADGRGFTLARRLRDLGYRGRLRAQGHVVADQYAMARRAGFDEIEISDDLARRQPAAQWQARADWRALNYQAMLRA